MKKSKKTSFSEGDLAHLFELCLEHFQKECFICGKLRKRMQNFIGNKKVQEIKNSVKKNGYCKK
ncbi:MAG: hypothetical protein WAN61_00275 [Minisyncoccia bacterium]